MHGHPRGQWQPLWLQHCPHCWAHSRVSVRPGVEGFKGGRMCFCYADRSFSLELMLACDTWQPPPGFSSLHWNHRRSQSNNPKKTTQTLRYSPNPSGRSKATHWCHQLACVNAKHATFWAMLAVGKSHPPQQVHRGLRKCLHLVHDLWPIRKSGPGPKTTFKLVSPYLS